MEKINIINVVKNKKIGYMFLKIMLILLVLVYVIAISPISLQNDTFFDIMLGQKYFSGDFYGIDNYSIHEGLTYQTHHFLSSIITYIVFNFSQYLGLYLLEIILVLIIATLLYFANRNFVKSKVLSYIFVFVQLFALSPFISIRAQMYSYIIFILEILLVKKYLDTGKRGHAILLGLLPLILINIHSGVIYYYFIILFVYMLNLLKIKFLRVQNDREISKKRLKTLIIIAIIGFAISFINIYGINGLTYGLKTLSNSVINNNISEFQPFNIKTSIGIWMFIYSGVFILSLIFSDRKIKLQEFFMFFGTLFMGLCSIRHFSLLIIASIILLPHIENVYYKLKEMLYSGIIEEGKKVINITIYAICIVIYIIVACNAKFGDNISYDYVPISDYPISAVQYIKANNIDSARIFNEYAWGSYLMFNNIKVFIDSRLDLYTAQYNKDTTVGKDYMDMISINVNYNEIVSKYNIEYFLIKKDFSLAKMMVLDVKYKKIYEDNIACIIKVEK
ncbi:MAG: hypothetical protein N2749_02380 [Clostridia bacterium]|nr:hypothetical protein [Clostridia bacterium]